MFRPNHLAPTFSPDKVVKPPRFNAYYDVEDLAPVYGDTWKLELAGHIGDKRPWTLRQIYDLPEQEIIIRHICVEGWDYIGQWSGREPAPVPRAHRCRFDCQVRRLPLCGRLLRKHRYALGAASADVAGDEVRRGTNHRSLRFPVAPAHGREARLQEPEMDHFHGGHKHLPRRILGGPRLQLVQRYLRSAADG